MIITTRFDINSEIWHMHGNRPVTGIVYQIKTSVLRNPCNAQDYNPSVVITYSDEHGSYTENSVFATKQQLLDSL